MSAPRLIVIGGGVRSGKSALALRLARQLGQRRAFIATAQPFDAEMQRRVERHVQERGSEFETIEEPVALVERLAQLSADVVVVDCLTLWLSNLLLAEQSESATAEQREREIEAAIDALSAALRARRCHIVVVTNEVGMGVVPETRLGRAFRDLSGRAHQRVCAQADEIYIGVLGCMLRIHPEPLRLMRPESEPEAGVDHRPGPERE